MDVSDASYYIFIEKKKNKGSQIGHTKKKNILKVYPLETTTRVGKQLFIVYRLFKSIHYFDFPRDY